jgi:hypothetical protein
MCEDAALSLLMYLVDTSNLEVSGLHYNTK